VVRGEECSRIRRRIPRGGKTGGKINILKGQKLIFSLKIF
jgi:hypothetical protein